jgi:hypothetical protein
MALPTGRLLVARSLGDTKYQRMLCAARLVEHSDPKLSECGVRLYLFYFAGFTANNNNNSNKF